jgi:hypothetical protein
VDVDQLLKVRLRRGRAGARVDNQPGGHFGDACVPDGLFASLVRCLYCAHAAGTLQRETWVVTESRDLDVVALSHLENCFASFRGVVATVDCDSERGSPAHGERREHRRR